MTDKTPRPGPPEEGFSLRRWSRRKLDATRVAPDPAGVPGEDRSAPPLEVSVTPPAPPAPADELPPVESLTIESDFTGFLKPGTDETLKRAALKQLFRDPRFNVMDGLDTYIDDYTKPDPIPPQMLSQLLQGRYIFDPPKTIINAQGHVVDAPAETSPGESADRVSDAAALENTAPVTADAGSPAPAAVPVRTAEDDAQ